MQPSIHPHTMGYLTAQYREVLLDYLGSPGEHDLDAVQSVGKQAAALNLDLNQLIGLHHDILLTLFNRNTIEKETVRLSGEILQEITAIHALYCAQPDPIRFSNS